MPTSLYLAASSALQWGRTLSSAETADVCQDAVLKIWGFNGAALFQVRKLVRMLDADGDENGLQWGRTLSSAETAAEQGIPARLLRLQWGRTLSSAET